MKRSWVASAEAVRGDNFRFVARTLAVSIFVSGAAATSPAWSQNYKYSTVYNFTGGADGFQPCGDLSMDNAGNVYAETNATYDTLNPPGNGAIVEINPVTHVSHLVVSLPSGTGAIAVPAGPFYFDKSNNLYGVSLFGGSTNGGIGGTFFEVPAGSHSATILASFNGTNGENPGGGLIADGHGNLYGTSSAGGIGYDGQVDSGDGTVFEIPAGSKTPTTLAEFNGTNGSDPFGKLLRDSSGNLFGVDFSGGSNNDGTLWELPAGSGTTQTLFNFTGADAGPQGGVIADAQGNLYGVTSGDGPGNGTDQGTIYEFNVTTQKFSTLHRFGGSDGSYPLFELYSALNGDLLGTTDFGGAYGVGNIFDFNLNTDVLTDLHDFIASAGSVDGIFGGSALIADGQGNLWGTAQEGGVYGAGTIFELSIPEPCSLALLAVTGAGLLMRGRR
jgi:uncharacterized repeat protein (TIGR03803 family)